MGRRLDRDADEVTSETISDFKVAEVIHDPQRDLGDLAGELLDLKPKELRDIDLAKRRDVEKAARIVLVNFFQNIHLYPPQLAVGDEKKVTATASRIKELQRGDSVVELLKTNLFLTQSTRRSQRRRFSDGRDGLRAVRGRDKARPSRMNAGDDLELLAQAVEEERTDHLQDVLLARVVRTEGVTLLLVHHALEHRAKDRG